MEIIKFGSITNDFGSLENNLSGNTLEKEIYSLDKYDKSSIPILINIIEEFISHWKDGSKYKLDQLILYNFYTQFKKESSWYPFLEKGCLIIFNPNKINFVLEVFKKDELDLEKYDLVGGGMIFLDMKTVFRFYTEGKSSKLKHIVIYKFLRS